MALKFWYLEQFVQVFLEGGVRKTGKGNPVMHCVEQKSWVDPVLWYAVCPLWSIFLQPEQKTLRATAGTAGSNIFGADDGTESWKRGVSCWARKTKYEEKVLGLELWQIYSTVQSFSVFKSNALKSNTNEIISNPKQGVSNFFFFF